MFLSLSLFLRKHVSSLAKSSRLKTSPPGCDNRTDPSHAANYAFSLLKPPTSVVSSSLSDWLFLKQTHAACAIHVDNQENLRKKRKEKREVCFMFTSNNMIAFITSNFISSWFDSLSGGDVVCRPCDFILKPGSSVYQGYYLGQITNFLCCIPLFAEKVLIHTSW